ncbi:MAG TPA: hypothetical protein VGT61_08925 [Thermomicrobiales bacterium]|jgi:hypothetical protein|nr:hypothetical protein [Thermomicrobiales bacterium]
MAGSGVGTPIMAGTGLSIASDSNQQDHPDQDQGSGTAVVSDDAGTTLDNTEATESDPGVSGHSEWLGSPVVSSREDQPVASASHDHDAETELAATVDDSRNSSSATNRDGNPGQDDERGQGYAGDPVPVESGADQGDVIALESSTGSTVGTASESESDSTSRVFSWSDSSIRQAEQSTSAGDSPDSAGQTSGTAEVPGIGSWRPAGDAPDSGSDVDVYRDGTSTVASESASTADESTFAPAGAAEDPDSQPGNSSSDWEPWSTRDSSGAMPEDAAPSSSDSSAMTSTTTDYSADTPISGEPQQTDFPVATEDAPYAESPRAAATPAAADADLLRMVDELRTAVSDVLARQSAVASPATGQLAEAGQILSGVPDAIGADELDRLEQAVADVDANEFDYRYLQALGAQRSLILSLVTAYRQRGDTIDQLRSIVSAGDAN